MTLLTLVRLRTAKGTNSDAHGEYGKGLGLRIPQLGYVTVFKK